MNIINLIDYTHTHAYIHGYMHALMRIDTQLKSLFILWTCKAVKKAVIK